MSLDCEHGIYLGDECRPCRAASNRLKEARADVEDWSERVLKAALAWRAKENLITLFTLRTAVDRLREAKRAVSP